ncbi:serine/threonine protein kinase [Nostoc parmelioides]|uniref:non-specific serine/threonine protein kinase n=1 Tax=Nostoc parmelioides FACHB-3921 TaxID=2692909 RepID=A0ABR8BKF4_9NOSO|nr:serine/threonine-protein kinase [Nostoc parmelioides]MBD2253980.1 serine/threonine protein kinase [Nostoc parmelioides FACHB-3921]
MELDAFNKGAIPLINHPDCSALGYQVIRELGRNQEEGRITYLAHHHSKQQVVIKEFSFAHTYTDWFGFTAYESEAQILQKLNHPRIPRYLDSFATQTAFYLVQEYKHALPLSSKRSFQAEEIKQIAVSILEILVYLQQRIDPIIHRDIKPENILVDDQLNAYLVDFGLARVQDTKIALTSLLTGTPGFIPPEEQLGYSLSLASDLYSLGATLVCLLANIRSVDIGKLINNKGYFDFQKLDSPIDLRFRSWLMGMVEPKWQYRYTNAADALAALQPIQVTGNATAMEILATVIKLKYQTTVLCLAIIGVLAVAGATLILSQQGGSAQQLQEARKSEVL